MLRFSLTAAVLLFSTAVAGAGRAAPQASGAAGQSASTAPMQFFTSSEGRFSVMMPGTPAKDSQQAKLGDSASTTIYQFSVSLANDNISYMVMYNDYPAGYAEDAPQAVLARTRDGAVKSKTLNSDQAIEMTVSAGPDASSSKDAGDQGRSSAGAVVPGRAFTAADSDGWNYSVRQFLRGKRLYQLIVVSGKGMTAAQTGEFMNSFRIF
ncbi:MAG: hypothetical protein ACLQHF_01225 [Terracidiphilus sp.]